jgi:hypothetical protein
MTHTHAMALSHQGGHWMCVWVCSVCSWNLLGVQDQWASCKTVLTHQQHKVSLFFVIIPTRWAKGAACAAVQIYIYIYLHWQPQCSVHLQRRPWQRVVPLSLLAREGRVGGINCKAGSLLDKLSLPHSLYIIYSDGAKSVTEVGGAEAVETPKHIR